ncbi:hypothetical protein CAY59_14640 [Vibrio campbellii]|nr:hypothetical protein CAY59_14640 [Vibrio campbellii]AUW02994.1 hypothetical protein C1N51_04060 [Vibrio campbellii]OPH51799.1 hypothetical protein B4U81_15230 [Vibrio campbellii]
MGGFFTPEGGEEGTGFALQNAALRESGAGFALRNASLRDVRGNKRSPTRSYLALEDDVQSLSNQTASFPKATKERRRESLFPQFTA